jgi:hypothetical protein
MYLQLHPLGGVAERLHSTVAERLDACVLLHSTAAERIDARVLVYSTAAERLNMRFKRAPSS